MADLVALLFSILLLDILNPVLLAVMIVAAASSRPVANSLFLLLGHTSAYICVGLVASYALEALSQRLQLAKPADLLISAVLGLACLFAAYIAFTKNKTSEPAKNTTPDQASALSYFLYGAIINFVGAPFALPYFAAIDTVSSADISLQQAYLLLLGYNIGYALPFLAVPLAAAFAGAKATKFLETINRKLSSLMAVLSPWLLLGLALYLLLQPLAFVVEFCC
ncbi:cytochrome c biogenesis CcdA family protein [Agaribacterium haliotis]|uniref:cytochrome c biogenesis CcdA family protein n=1 Tax=Agaribacterium haliotis TaxID=2013869 RepID=UPI000BB53BDC|nr:GAP family protein [Agaribacterium haliotis]